MVPQSEGKSRHKATLAGNPHVGEGAGGEMLELSREECLQLLASNRFGRLAVTMGEGAPVIRPVNYLFDVPTQSVVFRTASGSKLHALLHARDAAFEIDGIDHSTEAGWSVIIRGVSEQVTRPSEVERLDRLGLKPWAPGPKRHWMQIRAWTVSGRRIVLADDSGR